MSRQARLDNPSQEDEEKDFYNPRSQSFCRACVDLSTFKKLKPESRQESPYFLDPKGCPIDKTGLGRAAWTLLHTMAAYYPNHPTYKQMAAMENFFSSFAEFFPCKYCAMGFKENISKHPVDASNRLSLSGWLCMQHNLVNEKLKKPLFDCSKVLERWRYGWADGSCDLSVEEGK
uniref:Sulfhydryl oxidase n=1 Tax=Schistocephalus solidus TaxID=70667 RepID=A0A0X3PHM0_SCHSO